MNAGMLRHPILLERPRTEVDARGNRLVCWAPIARVYASLRDVSGRDFFEAQAHQAQDIVTFGIRWREDLTKECRIVYRGQAYGIEQINHLGYRRDFMHIKARLVTGEGM